MGDTRLSRRQIRLGNLYIFLTTGLLALQLALTCQLLARQQKLGLLLSQLSAKCRQRSAACIDRGLLYAGVNFHQQLALLDLIAHLEEARPQSLDRLAAVADADRGPDPDTDVLLLP